MAALLGIIAALAGGTTISIVLAALTVTDWISLFGLILGVGGDIEKLVKLLIQFHPYLKELEGDLLAGKFPHEDVVKQLRAKFAAMHPHLTLPLLPHHSAPPLGKPSYDDPSKLGGQPKY